MLGILFVLALGINTVCCLFISATIVSVLEKRKTEEAKKDHTIHISQIFAAGVAVFCEVAIWLNSVLSFAVFVVGPGETDRAVAAIFCWVSVGCASLNIALISLLLKRPKIKEAIEIPVSDIRHALTPSTWVKFVKDGFDLF